MVFNEICFDVVRLKDVALYFFDYKSYEITEDIPDFEYTLKTIRSIVDLYVEFDKQGLIYLTLINGKINIKEKVPNLAELGVKHIGNEPDGKNGTTFVYSYRGGEVRGEKELIKLILPPQTRNAKAIVNKIHLNHFDGSKVTPNGWRLHKGRWVDFYNYQGLGTVAGFKTLLGYYPLMTAEEEERIRQVKPSRRDQLIKQFDISMINDDVVIQKNNLLYATSSAKELAKLIRGFGVTCGETTALEIVAKAKEDSKK